MGGGTGTGGVWVDTELSVVTNAIAYALSGGVPPHPIEISAEDVGTYRYAAHRALLALQSLKALPPVDSPYDWEKELLETPHGDLLDMPPNHWSAWPVEHGLGDHCCFSGHDIMNCGCCRTHPAIGCQSARTWEPCLTDAAYEEALKAKIK